MRVAAIVLLAAAVRPALAAEPPPELQALPLFSLSDLQYVGGLRFPLEPLGASSMTYVEGPVAVGPRGESLFAVGHAHQQAVAEFAIPRLVPSLDPNDFEVATPLQPFAPLLDRPEGGNPQRLDRIGGMLWHDGKLIVNGYVYYDAPASTTHTTLIVADASALATSAVAGFFSYGAHAHAAGWISPIPAEWQGTLGGTHIVGHSSGLPIINRLSVGPSAFALDLSAFGTRSARPIPLVRLLDFSLAQPLGAKSRNVERYLMNDGLDNDLWTHLSRAVVGVVVPGTRTYLTLGVNGGTATGIGYKLQRENGAQCDGYCPKDPADYANYYWLWDLDDLTAVKERRKAASSVLPYAYGKLEGYDLGGRFSPVIGGAFDDAKGLLYLALSRGGAAEWSSAVLAFRVSAPSPPSP